MVNPVIKTNHPKAGFNLEPGIYFESCKPIKIPIIDNAAIDNNKVQSIIYSSEILPINPMLEFNTIITNEVPIAFFIGSFAKMTNAGIIKNPPPAPTNPAKNPTPKPIIIINK